MEKKFKFIIILLSFFFVSGLMGFHSAAAETGIEEPSVSGLSNDLSDPLPTCEKKEKAYDPNAPLDRGGGEIILIIDKFGNSRSSIKLNEKTDFSYGIGNSGSTKCLMEIEISVIFHEKDDSEKQISYEKLFEKFEPGEGRQITWSFDPVQEGRYTATIKPNGFPPSIRDIDVVSPSQHDFPPLKQIGNGVLPENVVCKPDMKLILKSTDGSPACVFNSTAQKLIERGWAKP